MTSHDVVGAVRRRLPRKTKVGHLGTLDPAACGVLPVATGGATKLIPLLPDLGSRMKGYLGHLQLGVTTTTDDLEGEVLKRADPGAVRAVSLEQIETALSKYLGESSQTPPQVSAVRQDGKRAYERVRRGEVVVLKARIVHIDELRLLDYCQDSGRIKIFMACGSGTYVRSLARDLGEDLGVGGALAFLLRTHSGPFHLHQAVSLEEFYAGGWQHYLLDSHFPFAHLPKLTLPARVEQKGQRFRGKFEVQGLFRADGGLLRTLVDDPQTAVVEAML